VPERVRFVGDPSVVGTLVEPPPWDRDGWPHVVWDGDAYVCVLRPEEVETVGGPRYVTAVSRNRPD
jgi:hypothetical protein